MLRLSEQEDKNNSRNSSIFYSITSVTFYGCKSIFGKGDLQAFKDKATLFATAANKIFGADIHLTKGKPEMLNGNGAYVKELYTSDPVGAAFVFVAGFYGLMRGQYFKSNGGKDRADFMTDHSTKHMYNETTTRLMNPIDFSQFKTFYFMQTTK